MTIRRFIDKYLNNRGTALVDAVIVIPLVILSVMAIIYLLLNIYSTVSLQSHMHILLREESGIKSGMVKYEIEDGYKRDSIRRKAELTQILLEHRNNILSDYVEAEKTSTYTTNMMISRKPTVRTYGRSYINNESKIVRFKEVVKAN
jgi:hypothetical protein